MNMPQNPPSRQFFRKQRRQLSSQQRHRAAFLASRFLPKLHDLLPKNANIGLYLDDFGELPTDVLMKFCQQYGHQAYLPITKAGQPLTFAPLTKTLAQTPTKRHQLGMLEPTTKPIITARRLDAIICPLVAVDKQGVRLGMGGGFYDRTLSVRPKPLAIGWCYDFQIIDQLPKQAWDETMDIIISDCRFIRLN